MSFNFRHVHTKSSTTRSSRGYAERMEQTIQLKLATAGSTIDIREQPEALITTAPTAGIGISGEVLN